MEKNNTQLSRKKLELFPKIELHVHLDCCLSFDVVSQLRPGISRERYNKDFIGANKYKNLAHYLKLIDNSLELMQTEKGLRLVTQDLFQQFKRDNIIYAEIRFAPLLHLRQGLTPEEVVAIVEETVSQCVKDTGIEAQIILCTLRHHTEEESMRTVRLVERFLCSRVIALDLSADEAGYSITAHRPAFEYASERKIKFTAHAGEAKGPESVWEVLSYFETYRVGHGVRSIEDPLLMETLKKRMVHLEVCPSCNVQIDIFDTYADHPIDRLYNAGISVGINTDSRAITNITLTDEYERLQQTFGWGFDHFVKCNRNAILASFLPMEKKLDIDDMLAKLKP
jgi:adenosine deaminase